jgi:signal transduction histidine kinase
MAVRDVSTRGDVRSRRKAGRSAMPDPEAVRLAARVEQLEREKASLEAFAAVAAHELVEPLIITEAFAAMVSDRLDEDVHAESRSDLATLRRTAKRTRHLLEALLQDARSGEHSLARRPVDLGAVVAECVDVLAHEVEARGATVRLGEMPTVPGDASLLNGLFTNLLLNALKYSPRYGSEIVVEASRENGTWRVAVESEGPTIPQEDRRRIFEPFQRGRSERRLRGAGLGLTICRRIVERHGGHIGVAPAARGGNRFYFTLPA